jgi:hypothetical protein
MLIFRAIEKDPKLESDIGGKPKLTQSMEILIFEGGAYASVCTWLNDSVKSGELCWKRAFCRRLYEPDSEMRR